MSDLQVISKEVNPMETVDMRNVGLADIMFDVGKFAQMQRVAKLLMQSGLVPESIKGKSPEEGIANVILAFSLAMEMKENPLIVMQNIYFVSGRAGWSSQYIIAKANKAGVFASKIRWRKSEGELITITHKKKVGWDKEAREAIYRVEISKQVKNLAVTAYATLLGEKEPVEVTVDLQTAELEGWTTNIKYHTMAEHMLCWRSAAMLVRRYAPEVMLGYSVVEELETIQVDQPPPPEKPRATLPSGTVKEKLAAVVSEQIKPELTVEPVVIESVQEPTTEEAVDTETKELEEAFQKASELANKLSEPAKWRVAIEHAYGMKSTERLHSLAASMALAIEQKAKIQAEAKAAPAQKQEPVHAQPQAELPPKQELKLNRLGELIKTAVDEEVLTKEEAVAFWNKHSSGADQRPIMEDIEKLITPREAKMLHEAVAGKITDFAQKKDWLALCPKLHESGWYRALPALIASGRMEKSGSGAGSKYKPVIKSVIVQPVKPEAPQESPVKAAEKALEKALEDGIVTIEKADSIQEDIDFYVSQMDEAALLGLADKLTKGTI